MSEYNDDNIAQLEKETREIDIESAEGEIYENYDTFIRNEEEKKEIIFNIIKDNPQITLDQISKKCEIPVKQVEWFISDLEQEKKIISLYVAVS